MAAEHPVPADAVGASSAGASVRLGSYSPVSLLSRIDTFIVGMVALGGALLVAADITQRWILPERTWTLDIDGRFNAETWFHSLVLAGAAFSALGIAATFSGRHRNVILAWLFVGGVLAFMSFDKSISFHERLGQSLEETFELHDEAGRVLWQLVYAPLLASFALVFVWCVRGERRAMTWVVAGIAACASKLVLEALMFPLIKFDVTSEQGILYGIEVNLEESIQLLGFALFFGAVARLFIQRIAQLGPDFEGQAGAA
jgi:hypothetical protein